METFSFAELCTAVGKEALVVRRLQRELNLHVPGKDGVYSEAYVRFLEKIVALRAFNIPLDRVTELFETEKKVLRLLHIDSLSHSPTWYLDACASARELHDGENTLMLTGHDLGFPVSAGSIQHHLDFGDPDPELFPGDEMGEDVRQVLRLYLDRAARIVQGVRKEKPVLENALSWAGTIIARHRRRSRSSPA